MQVMGWGYAHAPYDVVTDGVHSRGWAVSSGFPPLANSRMCSTTALHLDGGLHIKHYIIGTLCI